MSVELLQTLSLVSYILAAVLFLVAIALFFLLQVPKLFGDVTGSTARKAIETIRQQNESTGDKAYKPSAVNAARGKLTDKISPSGRLEQRITGMGVSAQTEKFDTTDLNPQSSETTVLSNTNETTVLAPPTNETTALNEMPSMGETTVLSQPTEDSTAEVLKQSESDSVTVDVEMGFTGSSELIE